MIISEKQLFLLITVLRDSIAIEFHGNKDLFTLPHNQRLELLNKIINQQSDKLEEVQ